nr:Snf7 domain containing protein [Haemonchus contortus]
MSRPMSLFGKIFGGKKQEVAPSTQDAIQKLRETEEMLIKKQDFLEKKIKDEVATAVKHGTKNKRLALHALGRKKQFEKQLNHIDGVLQTIEFQREALENASTNAEVLQVMGGASKALKAAHNNMDIDQVHDLMEDIAEQQEVANEIAEAISNPVGFDRAIDDEELLRELEQLEQEELDKQLLDVQPTPVVLPDAPSTDLPASSKAKPAKTTDHDKDLEDLEMWANA